MSDQNDEFISIQPDNSTVIEESLEFAWDKLIAELKCPYPDLKNPATTGDDFVPLLASECGVLDWQLTDTPAQQRRNTENAFQIHSKAGTRHGLAVAMDALDCDIEVTPWYQMNSPPAPYYMEVVAWKRNFPINKQTTERMLSRIESTKSERDNIDLVVAFGVDSTLNFSGAAHDAIVEYDENYGGVLPESPVIAAPASMAGGVWHLAVHDDEYRGKLPNNAGCSGNIYAAGASLMVVITDVNFGVTT